MLMNFFSPHLMTTNAKSEGLKLCTLVQSKFFFPKFLTKLKKKISVLFIQITLEKVKTLFINKRTTTKTFVGSGINLIYANI